MTLDDITGVPRGGLRAARSDRDRGGDAEPRRSRGVGHARLRRLDGRTRPVPSDPRALPFRRPPPAASVPGRTKPARRSPSCASATSACRAATPDYHALLLLNMVLGGQFVSRINMNLREDKGYTYGARTGFDSAAARSRSCSRPACRRTRRPRRSARALAEIAAMRGARPVTATELDSARAALTRGYPRNFETAEQVARAAAQIALHDLPDDYFSTFVPQGPGAR